MSPYPQKPKQPDTGERRTSAQEYPTVEPAPMALPTAAAASPQVTAGAPKIAYRGEGRFRVGEDATELDFNTEIPLATGSGGPERWDVRRREIFSGDNLRYLTASPEFQFDVTEILTDYPQAVDALRDQLLERRKGISDAELRDNEFWRRFDEQGQAFVAEIIGRITGQLSARQRRLAEENPITLTQGQRQWVRNHPLARWLEWI